MSEQSLSEIRKRAWQTRRAKYGQTGHAGTYARTPIPRGRIVDGEGTQASPGA